MIAGGLLAGLGMVLAQYSQNANQVSKTAETNWEITQTLSEISIILSDGENCKESLKGPLGAPINSIKRIKGSVPIEVYKVDEAFGNRTLKIKSMKVIEDDGGYKLTLEITRIGNVLGAKDIVRKIPISATVSVPGIVESCSLSSLSGAGATPPGTVIIIAGAQAQCPGGKTVVAKTWVSKTCNGSGSVGDCITASGLFTNAPTCKYGVGNLNAFAICTADQWSSVMCY